MKNTYENYNHALDGLPTPCLFLDLDALKSNIDWGIKSAGSKKIRIATKSVRSVEVLKKIFNSSPIYQGLMTFTLKESLWLRSLGFKDILMGYPTTDRDGLVELAKDPEEIFLMVDSKEHFDFLEEIAKKENSYFNLCIDIDLSLDLVALRFGVYRSPITSIQKLTELLEAFKSYKHLKIIGVMGYEAQIAGVVDKNLPHIQILKNISLKKLKEKRQKMVDLVKSYGHDLKLVNGGGTGSLHETKKEDCVTEMTIGSAFYAPTLFDKYKDFSLTPALFFALSIVRRPCQNIFTCAGGGYMASGEIGPNKEPAPHLPLGLKLIKYEGAGEVQTPMTYTGELDLKIGDKVIMRYAKAGEACERFNEIHLIQNDKLIETVKTYRGEGKSFL